MIPYIDLLSVEERGRAMKLGAALAMSDAGMLKEAATPITLPGVLGGAVKSIVALSLIGGIPLGVAAHIIGSKVNDQQLDERELLKRISYYRNAGSQFNQLIEEDTGKTDLPTPNTGA